MEDIIDDHRPEDHLKTADRIAFVGPNSDYYINAWEKIENGKVLSINWGALFFGVGWFLYRKMYVEAAIFIALAAIKSFLQENFFPSFAGFEIIINLTIALIIGFIANTLYMRYTDRTIAAIKAESGDQPNYDVQLSKAGGTSAVVVIVAIILVVVLFALFS